MAWWSAWHTLDAGLNHEEWRRLGLASNSSTVTRAENPARHSMTLSHAHRCHHHASTDWQSIEYFKSRVHLKVDKPQKATVSQLAACRFSLATVDRPSASLHKSRQADLAVDNLSVFCRIMFGQLHVASCRDVGTICTHAWKAQLKSGTYPNYYDANDRLADPLIHNRSFLLPLAPCQFLQTHAAHVSVLRFIISGPRSRLSLFRPDYCVGADKAALPAVKGSGKVGTHARQLTTCGEIN